MRHIFDNDTSGKPMSEPVQRETVQDRCGQTTELPPVTYFELSVIREATELLL
jgi:hypothetical protein